MPEISDLAQRVHPLPFSSMTHLHEFGTSDILHPVLYRYASDGQTAHAVPVASRLFFANENAALNLRLRLCGPTAASATVEACEDAPAMKRSFDTLARTTNGLIQSDQNVDAEFTAVLQYCRHIEAFDSVSIGQCISG